MSQLAKFGHAVQGVKKLSTSWNQSGSFGRDISSVDDSGSSQSANERNGNIVDHISNSTGINKTVFRGCKERYIKTIKYHKVQKLESMCR